MRYRTVPMLWVDKDDNDGVSICMITLIAILFATQALNYHSAPHCPLGVRCFYMFYAEKPQVL